MTADKRYFPITGSGRECETVPFEGAEEAWFWFIQAQQARNDGARISAGASLYPRPCEPMDILKVAERLYRNRRLIMDHFLVLRHYGRRGYAPERSRVKEARAAKLWREAMERIEPMLINKGIVSKPNVAAYIGWAEEALVYEKTEV